jgi:hypothetical protein
MTPKEKAKELYNRYEFVYIQNYTSKHEVKQCALLAVDEILKSAPSKPGYGPYIESDIEQAAFYWQEVRDEIEKL